MFSCVYSCSSGYYLTISMNNSGINGHAAVLQNIKLIGVMHYLCWANYDWTSFITHNHFKSSKFEFEHQIKEEHKKEWTYKGY